ncbi:MAG: glycosyltransferase family 2 protein [Chloroflexi bacterium]|nr:glycosyltransferase family 2 protein [Chloroflexota bacterium]
MPTVTLMIAAYNEEKSIEEKIINSLSLDYPRDIFDIIVVSDGSTDKTDEIVKSYSCQGVQLYRVEGRVGKTEARNRAVLECQREIVVFSDATTLFHRDAIRMLVRGFADPSVGQISGHYKYFDPHDTNVGIATRLFWKYENLIKRSQNNLGTLTGVSGCINAFRRAHYTPLPPNIIEDLVEPLMFIIRGWRVIFEEEALAWEKSKQRVTQELNMRVRVIRGGITGLLFAKQILNPFRFPMVSFQIVSHKLLRWCIPIFCIVVFFSCLCISTNVNASIYQVLLAFQILFYLLGLLGIILDKFDMHYRLFSIPMYFCVSNYACLLAIYKTFTSRLEPSWETNV